MTGGLVREDRQFCVYKVGGSLFEWPELFERLRALLGEESRQPLIVAGGGGAADVVREWDRVHGLGEARAHRLAIGSLSLGAALLADELGGEIVASRDEARGVWNARRIPVLNVAAFLMAEEADGVEPLPASWEVTSDSIAAWVADRWPADLVLLKSATPATGREPFVDRNFANIRPRLRSCEWINLRTGERGEL